MSTLRTIGFWPSSGLPDRPWLELPDEDALVRSARSVCELYSQAVHQAGIANRHSELRLVSHLDAGREDVLVTVHPDVTQGFEMVGVSLPSGIADLTAADRARLVLEMVHAAAIRLGRDRGWDQDALAAAHDHALAAGLRYRWTGPGKMSPDRRHVARPVFVLHDDGFGRVVIEARRRDDDRVIAVSQPALTFSTSEGFQRSARTLRWQNKNSVGLVPWSGLFGDQKGLLSLDLAYPGEPGTAEPLLPETEPPSATALPQITVQVPAELGPRITVVGGGPMNGIPVAYEKTLDDLLDRLQAEPWQVWWAAEADDDLEIWYDFAATKTGIAIRHAHGRWRTTIRRPAATLAGVPDPTALARQDVDAMLAAIRQRTRLSEHPPL